MKPKKPINCILIAIFSIVFSLGIFLMPIFASSESNNNTKITVGVPADRCPMFYIDNDSGEIVGIGVDLMKSAAKEAGMDVTFVEISEQNLKEALDNAVYDLIMPFGSAIESASGMPSVVSDNLIQTPFTLVNTGKHVVSDVSMLKIGMLKSLGAGAETVKELYPNMTIIMYDSMSECVNALRKGEVDALLHNSYVWSYVLQKPSYKDLVVQPSAMFSMDFRAGTIDTSTGRELVERLNEGIALVPDTKRQAIVLDYTTRKLYKYDFSDMVYAYRYSIVIGALLFAALITALVLRQKAYFEEQKERMRLMEDIDSLTGVLSHNGFRKKVEELLANNPDTPYTISYNNI